MESFFIVLRYYDIITGRVYNVNGMTKTSSLGLDRLVFLVYNKTTVCRGMNIRVMDLEHHHCRSPKDHEE